MGVEKVVDHLLRVQYSVMQNANQKHVVLVVELADMAVRSQSGKYFFFKTVYNIYLD